MRNRKKACSLVGYLGNKMVVQNKMVDQNKMVVHILVDCLDNIHPLQLYVESYMEVVHKLQVYLEGCN